jgi:signal transduction histidine kinase
MFAGTKSREGGWLARVLRAALPVLPLIASFAAPAADPPPREPIVIERAIAAVGDGTHFPLDTSARTVELPHRWESTLPGYDGAVWYRSKFSLSSDAIAEELAGLYVERACSNLQVHLNGYLIFGGGRTGEPVFRNCARPQLLSLPPALLRPGENILDLRVQGFALDRVGSLQSAGGLSTIEIGSLAMLRDRHAARYFWGVTWAEGTSLLLIGIGCVLLAVGWLNRREVYFLYLGWLCLAWVVFTLVSMARQMPWPNDVTEFILVSMWPVLLALTVQFLLSFAGVRSRAIETLIALQWVVVPATLMLARPDGLFMLARLWYTLLGLELLAVMGIYLTVTLRQRPADFSAVAMTIVGGATALLIELAVQWGLLEAPRVSAARIVMPLLFAAVGARLMMMFARALRTMEDDRNRIAGQLHQLTAEMATRVQQLTEQRVGQFTEAERKRIASDLHDDLGAKLLTLVHTADVARVPELAREALDEMRLSVRGLDGKASRLDDAIADWRAEIVGRLEQAGIKATWTTLAPDLSPTLSARSTMQLTRILREAVSNVIKHSGATRCDIECTVEDSGLAVLVRDNGRGITQELSRGQGMASMKRRAKRLNGQCLVESTPGRGVLISLSVPLRGT